MFRYYRQPNKPTTQSEKIWFLRCHRSGAYRVKETRERISDSWRELNVQWKCWESCNTGLKSFLFNKERYLVPELMSSELPNPTLNKLSRYCRIIKVFKCFYMNTKSSLVQNKLLMCNCQFFFLLLINYITSSFRKLLLESFYVCYFHI